MASILRAAAATTTAAAAACGCSIALADPITKAPPAPSTADGHAFHSWNPKVKVHKVAVLTRHGDRTPAFWSNPKNSIGRLSVGEAEARFWSEANSTIIPSEDAIAEWARHSPWTASNAPSVTGTLTWYGAATHLANGIWLRERYVNALGLLPETLLPREVVSRSTPFPRCVQSCQNLLLGLYPADCRAAGDEGLTPITTYSRGYEPMYGTWFSSKESCPRMMQVLHEVYRTQHQWITADDRALENRVMDEIGCCPNGAMGLGDTIRCQQQYGLPLINGWSDEFASKVRDYAWRTFMARYQHPEFAGLMMAELLPEILSALDPRPANGGGGGGGGGGTEAEAAKMTIFAGHDASPMMPALVAFGVWDGKWPDYATMLTVEVISLSEAGTESYPESQTAAEDEYFVRAFYNHEQRPIKGCSRAGDNLCPLSTFIAMVNSRVPKDSESGCKLRTAAPAGRLSDDSPEASKSVLIDNVDGWGAGRHTGEMWRGKP